jgi:GNAT superfamily N-acetyltransferase
MPHVVTHERFDEENEDRFELAGDAGYAAATDQGHLVWILELWVDPDSRGQGRAAALLEAVLTHYAGRMVGLSAEPFTVTDHEQAGLSADQLAAWYARHGFQREAGCRMTRLPGGARASLAGGPAGPKAEFTSASGHMAAPASPPEERVLGPDSPDTPEIPLPAETAVTPGPQQGGEERFTYLHAEYDGGVHWFSAEHDGEEIAHAHVLGKQEPGGRHVEIKTLRTNPHYRCEGIGSQLIEEVASHFPGLEMRLKPYPIDEDGTQTTEDIRDFYAGRGFDRYQLKDGDPFELYDYMTRPASSGPGAGPAGSVAARTPESAPARALNPLPAWAAGKAPGERARGRRSLPAPGIDRVRQHDPHRATGRGR